MNNIEKIINSKLKNKISDFCIKISENIWKVEAKFTLDMIFWLISGWNILLSEIWRNLKEKISIKQTVKRLSRNLNNFDEEYLSEIKDNLLIQNKKLINKETVITLDWWDINKSWALKMENLKKIHDWSKWTIELWYCLNSIVATNIDKDWKPKTTLLNLNLYSTKAEEFISENNESINIEFSIPKEENPEMILYDVSYDLYSNKLLKVNPRDTTIMFPTPFVINDAVIVRTSVLVD